MAKSIDWYYFRNGGTSCGKASKFMDAHGIEPQEKVPASRKLQHDDARGDPWVSAPRQGKAPAPRES